MRKGLRKYTLDDGQVVDVKDVAALVPCSISLALARLNTSSDPGYIFMSKGLLMGHQYCIDQKTNKNVVQLKSEKIKYHKTGELKHFFDPMFRLAMRVI